MMYLPSVCGAVSLSGAKRAVLHERTDLTSQHAKLKPLQTLNQPVNSQLITDSSVNAVSARTGFSGIKAFVYIYRAEEKMLMILHPLI